MLARRCLIVLALAGCGRIDFGARGRAQPVDGAPGNDAAADASGATLPPGAKIWLRMDTGPAGAAGGIVDSAGGHTAACASAGCPTRVAALHGDGYDFAMQEIDIQYAPDLDASAGFTAAIWVRLDQLPASLGCVWSFPFDVANVYDTYTLCIDTDGTTVFDCEDPSGVANAQNGPAIAPGAWHHLAMTWDGATKRDYLDGVQVATSTVVIGHGTKETTLGAEGGAWFTPATVDDALYYTRALSAAEIAQLATP